uniref:Uncharacterized protein n=1 Tax=Cacopsylla melanoneura TaxID=428564 RepID=A0A8D9BF63_9HEMI
MFAIFTTAPRCFARHLTILLIITGFWFLVTNFISLDVCVPYFISSIVSMLFSNLGSVFCQHFILSFNAQQHNRDTRYKHSGNTRKKKTHNVKFMNEDYFKCPRLGFINEWIANIVRMPTLGIFGLINQTTILQIPCRLGE